jgi:hypothetical protein
MWTTRRVIAVLMGVVGAALVVRGAWGGIWPVSIQLIAGALLIVVAVLRWRSLM